ncbi:MAG: hypothetical protein J0L84_02955, partial [Verrucomicrobia bacterium]|nr:hypothetical protein [Verrucomicrobiota bacterium]
MALLSPFIHAAIFTWDGGGEGLWEDPTRWLPQQVPGENDTAVIGGREDTVIRVDGGRSVQTLVLSNPNATLLLQGSVNHGQAILNVAHGFVNEGTIELSSEISSYEARLTVSGGALTNAPGGVIRISEGTGGPRQLNASLDNRGLLEVSRDLTFNGTVANHGTVHLAEGRMLTTPSAMTWTHRQGAITGTGTLALADSSTFVLEEDFTPGGFILDAPNLTINGPARLLGPVTGEFLIRNWTINAEVVVTGDLRIDGVVNFNSPLAVSAGKTLRLMGSVNHGQAILNVAHGFVNEGTIELSSEISSYEARLTVSGGAL